MNLIHIALTGRVTDGFTYQDNLLPKYHNKLGYNVALITSHYIHGDSGTLKVDPRDKYINEHGIQIVRIPIKREKEFNYKFKTYHYLYRELNRLQPDIIFVHSVQFLDIITIVNYLELYPHTKVYVDNHADFSNSATNWFSHNILHKVIWRRMAKKIEPYVNKFWGVLPARVDFLRKVYKLPENKTDLLVMGADDDLVEKAISNSMKSNIRQNHKINSDDYLLISGGKIDNAKRQVLNLMDAVHKLPSNYKLIVFGSVTYELQKNFLN